MHSELEIVQVLRTAAEDLDAERLVKWGIPYDRILAIVRELIQTGYFEATDGKIVLTARGRARLETGKGVLYERRSQKRSVIEPVRSATQLVVDYIPPKLVD